MGKELSAQMFIISMIVISVISLAAIGSLYYILNQDTILQSTAYTPATKPPSSFTLEIKSPEDNSLLEDQSLVVSGKSAPQATIIITNGANTVGFEADKDGEFSKIVTLVEGANNLTVTAFDKQGSSKMMQKQVYFTKEKLEDAE